MVELSVEEAQRLARQFLTGAATTADVSRLQAALADDQTVALELLAQIQTALDVPPAGLSVEHARSVDSRVEALLLPRVKRSGPFGWLKKLFRPKPKSEAEAEAESAKKSRWKTGKPTPAEAELPEPTVAPVADAMLEDMAPIASAADETMPGPAAVAESRREETFVREEAPAKARPARQPNRWAKPLLLIVLALLVLAGLVWGAIRWYHHRAVPPPMPLPKPVPTMVPKPMPSPTPVNRGPRRERSLAPINEESLPAQFPEPTPRAAGSLD